MCRPPVTSSTVPVMYEDRSEARNRATEATSLGSAGAAHRDLGQLLVPDPLRHGLGHGRADQAGLDRVDPHAQVGDLLGGGLGQADDAGLGGRVVGLADQADLAGDRRDVHDRTAFRLAHDAGGQPGAVPGALQVHGDDLVELLLGHLAHGRVAGDAGVVDHDVQAAEGVDGRPDERLHLGRPRPRRRSPPWRPTVRPAWRQRPRWRRGSGRRAPRGRPRPRTVRRSRTRSPVHPR